MSKKVYGFKAIAENAEEACRFLEDKLTERMMYRGEQGIAVARINGNYTDRTANLRNSIGYTLVDAGEEQFEKMIGDSDPATPSEEGNDVNLSKKRFHAATDAVKELTNKDAKAVIVVAGMEYGLPLQHRGYDVVQSAQRQVFAGFSEDVKKVIGVTIKKWGQPKK